MRPLVPLPQAREVAVELAEEVVPLPVAQRHAHRGEDVRGPTRRRPLHNCSDVLRAILDEGKNGHHRHTGLDAVVRQNPHRGQTSGGSRSQRFDLRRQLVIRRRDRETHAGINLYDTSQRLKVLEQDRSW